MENPNSFSSNSALFPSGLPQAPAPAPAAPPELPDHRKKRLIAALIALIVLLALVAAAWFGIPYVKRQMTLNESEEKRSILESLPANTENYERTTEERERILEGLGGDGA